MELVGTKYIELSTVGLLSNSEEYKEKASTSSLYSNKIAFKQIANLLIYEK